MKYTRILYFFFLSFHAFAQQDLSAGGSIMAGSPMNRYDNHRQVLTPRWVSSALGASLFVQYRLFGRIGMEAGLTQNVQNLRMEDNTFPDRNPGFKVRLASTNYYWSYYGALSYAQPITRNIKVYLSLGYSFNNSGSASLSKTKNFIVSGEDVTLRSNYMNNNASLYSEAGTESMISKRLVFFMGIRWNKGLSDLIAGEYIAQKDGNILSSDRYATRGSFVGLNLGFRVNIFHKDKKTKQPEPVPVKKEIPAIVTPNATPKTVEGRPLVITHKITVKHATVTVLVWDDQKVDGDRISLYLNDQWILHDYTLEKNKKTMVVTLRPGENTFVLHALNLGKIKPNTAALIIDDGASQQKLLLESDLESSGTLIIDYKQ
jgi:hypothetical protein